MNFVVKGLLDVQKEALKRSAGAVGFGYFMEQGLGKTLTNQADLLERVEEGSANRSIVVCPNSFKAGWIADTEKWGLPINQYIYESGSQHHLSWLRRDSDMVRQIIVNYEALRSGDTMRFLQEYASSHSTFLTFDESILISTHNAAQTKAAIELSQYATFSRILSGKPIKQGPHDLWSQMRAIKQLNGYAYYPFKTMFCKMGGFKMKQVMGAQNEQWLAGLIDPHVFRATKADWTDLPPKVWTERNYKMSGEQLAQYKSMEEEFVLWLNDNEVVAVDAAITKYIKLMQIQCGFIIDEERKIRELVPDEKNPRLQLLLNTLDMEVTGKACIVYHNKAVFQQLLRALGGVHKVAYITGGMQPGEIEEQKRRFNEDDSIDYILLQDDASKYGHTLLGTAKEPCYTMIFYQNSYSLDTRSQIEDRIHRHGQTADSVLYLDLVGTPLDRDAVRALQRKESIFQAIVTHLRR